MLYHTGFTYLNLFGWPESSNVVASREFVCLFCTC